MALPEVLLRKLYKRGSLRRHGEGRFSFVLQNPLGKATVVRPPEVVVNGIHYPPQRIEARASKGGRLKDAVPVEVASISRDRPFVFARGDEVRISLTGFLLRGGNRIRMTVATKEWGELELFVEEGSPPKDSGEEE